MEPMKWRQGDDWLWAFGRWLPVSCRVRNDRHAGVRAASEIVYTTNRDGSRGVPYMPQMFPVSPPEGWPVSMPLARNQPDRAPWYISTDAWQMVDEWIVENGLYVRPAGHGVEDWAYGAHFSIYPWTQGCIKAEIMQDIIWLAGMVRQSLYKDGDVRLIVE